MKKTRTVTLYIALALFFVSCSNPTKEKLKLAETDYWHLTRTYELTADGQKTNENNFEIKNSLDHPFYEHTFLSFIDDERIEKFILGSAPGITESFELKSAFEDDYTKIRIGTKGNELDLNDDKLLWTIDSLSSNVLILSRFVPSGEGVVHEYQVAKKFIPGSDDVAGITEVASAGASERGLTVEKLNESVYQEKRMEFLSLHPDSMDLPYWNAQTSIATIIEYTKEGVSVLIYTDRNGASEVYYSNGIVQKGGEKVKIIKDATKKMISESGRFWEYMNPETTKNIPQDGEIRFYLVNSSNTGEIYTTTEKAASYSRDLGILYKEMETIVNKYNTALSIL